MWWCLPVLQQTVLVQPKWIAQNRSNRNPDHWWSLFNLNQQSCSKPRMVKPIQQNPRDYDNNGDGKLDGNPNGHVIRWREDNGNHAALKFQWDVYAFGTPFDLAAANSVRLNCREWLLKPEIVYIFDPRGVMCEFEQMMVLIWKRTNCMMLVALPGQVGDGTSSTSWYCWQHILARSQHQIT